MITFGIETSCDETAAAVVEYDPKRGCFFIHSNVISSQVKIHAKYGGIVPEVAARNHVTNIIPVVDQALAEFRGEVTKKGLKETRNHRWSGASKKQETKANDLIDAIAVTNGPGLITSLMVGVETAKALAYAWGKPLVAVNHIEGHIYSAISQFQNMESKIQDTRYKIQDTNKIQITNNKFQTNSNPPAGGQISNFKLSFPALALIVSGGHTQLALMTNHGKYKIVGETRDDAAGEAFDKVAKLLGLGYPGGPIIAAEAEKFLTSNCLISNKIQNSKFKSSSNNKFQKKPKLSIINYQLSLPRPMIDSKDFDFSFSGLKTAVLYALRGLKTSSIKHQASSICAEFQQAVIDVLATKTQKAAKRFNAKTIILAGGVSANKELRKRFEKEFGDKLLLPEPGLSTDNAAMIAMAGVYHYLKKDFVGIDKVRVDPNLSID